MFALTGSACRCSSLPAAGRQLESSSHDNDENRKRGRPIGGGCKPFGRAAGRGKRKSRWTKNDFFELFLMKKKKSTCFFFPVEVEASTHSVSCCFKSQEAASSLSPCSLSPRSLPCFFIACKISRLKSHTLPCTTRRPPTAARSRRSCCACGERLRLAAIPMMLCHRKHLQHQPRPRPPTKRTRARRSRTRGCSMPGAPMFGA